MKKLITLLLCIAMMLSVVACGNKTDTNTATETVEGTNTIDIGGGIGEVTYEGEAFGSYKLIETPEDFVYEGVETKVYEDLNCNTPYIAVYRFDKGDYTLETLAQEEADEYGKGYYQMFENDNEVNRPGAYICYKYETPENYYYCDLLIIEDGDDFVEIEYCGKTEEIKIGDTDVYAWIPTGYVSYMDDDYMAHNAVLAAGYSDDYYYPNMFIGKWNPSYEYLEWYLGEDYPDGLPYTEEEYTEFTNNLSSEEDWVNYYTNFGHTIEFDSYESEQYDYEGGFYVLKDGADEGTELWFKIGEDWYIGWFDTEFGLKPAFTRAFLESLHTK